MAFSIHIYLVIVTLSSCVGRFLLLAFCWFVPSSQDSVSGG